MYLLLCMILLSMQIGIAVFQQKLGFLPILKNVLFLYPRVIKFFWLIK